jgi:hypothetical protein
MTATSVSATVEAGVTARPTEVTVEIAMSMYVVIPTMEAGVAVHGGHVNLDILYNTACAM